MMKPAMIVALTLFAGTAFAQGERDAKFANVESSASIVAAVAQSGATATSTQSVDPRKKRTTGLLTAGAVALASIALHVSDDNDHPSSP
jgi:hypothetical protein